MTINPPMVLAPTPTPMPTLIPASARPRRARPAIGMLVAVAVAVAFAGLWAGHADAAVQAPAAAPDAERCDALAATLQGHWPDPTTRLVSSRWNPAGPYTPSAMPGAPPPSPLTLPDHCEVLGILHERVGVAGQHYAIRFHLRLPASWNGRFFFQGGGGSDGVVGEAVGPTSAITPPALVQGFAVVSQDSGHDNATNSDPARGGAVAFGFDPRARADYGHASLKVVADAAKAAVQAYYGKSPTYSYFVGCSKGGQEGMVFAQRYPTEFNGIIAAAPGFALPRAAVAEAWDVQSLATVGAAATDTAVMAPASTAGVAAASDAVLARPSDAPPKPPAALLRVADAFSESDLNLVRDAILSVCDADDGVKDGLVGQFTSCTDARVRPAIETLRCATDKTATCLTHDQLTALERLHGGPQDSQGRPLYRAWQWDAGIAGAGWRLWKMGSSDHKIPALNVALGGSSLAAVFTTPPTAVSGNVEAALNYQLAFDFDRDAPRILATDAEFAHSAWDDVSARSSDLDRFRAHGGKLIVPHGVSDPVFSVLDTLDWYREVNARNDGRANRFVRVFPVPGMNHCSGGPATDNFDAFAALRDWVERGIAPERLLASAGPRSPWPGRSRPLCPFPKTAHYLGRGSVESAESFDCR